MDQQKPIWQSKTIVALAVAAIATGVGAVFHLSPSATEQVQTNVNDVYVLLVQAISLAIAAYGRITATHAILKQTPEDQNTNPS